MLRSKTARWVMWLFLASLLLSGCVMLYPYAAATSFPSGPYAVGAVIGFVGFCVSGLAVFARVVTWPPRRQRSKGA